MEKLLLTARPAVLRWFKDELARKGVGVSMDQLLALVRSDEAFFDYDRYARAPLENAGEACEARFARGKDGLQ